jgi:hypothetical protein
MVVGTSVYRSRRARGDAGLLVRSPGTVPAVYLCGGSGCPNECPLGPDLFLGLMRPDGDSDEKQTMENLVIPRAD